MRTVKLLESDQSFDGFNSEQTPEYSRNRLNFGEQQIMQFIDERGFVSTMAICLHTLRGRFAVQNSLNTLYKMGLIVRSPKGMNISNRWLSENPKKKSAIEGYLKYPLK